MNMREVRYMLGQLALKLKDCKDGVGHSCGSRVGWFEVAAAVAVATSAMNRTASSHARAPRATVTGRRL